MREILYRGKRKDNGEWVYGDWACSSNHACFANERKYRHYIFKDVFLDWGLGGLEQYEVIPETVGQYAGLCDKNGNKIFEGDIIKNEYGYIGEVVFKACQYYIEWQSGNFSIDLYVWGDSVEVIGNIHDNPELLEVER